LLPRTPRTRLNIFCCAHTLAPRPRRRQLEQKHDFTPKLATRKGSEAAPAVAGGRTDALYQHGKHKTAAANKGSFSAYVALAQHRQPLGATWVPVHVPSLF